MSAHQPNLDTVTTINRDGSRYRLQPADVKGRFTWGRRAVGVLLIAIYVLLPWISIGGYPAVFLDVMNLRFHFFGLTFAAQDLWLGFFVITGLGFSLFYITSLFGRLWCGWTCPYTVFLEHVFRRVERLIDGDAAARKRLADAPFEGVRAFKSMLKHAIYVLLAAAIAHVFLSYFVSLPRLWDMMSHGPGGHPLAFGVVLFLTAVLYGAFAWFREQFCIVLCPYGRLQSALTDDNTMVIGYDAKRGEPRGKASDPTAGSCINCLRCVQVCPTGIDIRNGLQMECIGCAACIDACDAIMDKLERPRGLVRYDSHQGLNGSKTRWVRPRTILYSLLLVLGVVALSIAVSKIKPFVINMVRLPGAAPYFLTDETVRNQFQLRLLNKRERPLEVAVEIENAPAGTKINAAANGYTVKPAGEEITTLIIEVPISAYKGKQEMVLKVKEKEGAELKRRFEFAGPDPTLLAQDKKASAKP